MASRRSLPVLLVLLVAVLAFLTHRIEMSKTGKHPHEEQATHEKSKNVKIPEANLEPLPGIKEVTTPSGLKYQDIKIGNGPQPKPGDRVIVHYTGWIMPSGRPFDSSLLPGRKPFEFRLGRGEVIKGWDEGVATMRVGGKRRLTIPPELGYGEFGQPPAIAPNTTLVFDIELLRIK